MKNDDSNEDVEYTGIPLDDWDQEQSRVNKPLHRTHPCSAVAVQRRSMLFVNVILVFLMWLLLVLQQQPVNTRTSNVWEEMDHGALPSSPTRSLPPPTFPSTFLPDNTTHTTMHSYLEETNTRINHNNSNNNNNNNIAELLQALATKTPLPIPFQPPFRIVQLARTRTGSTFQFHLLDGLAQLKSRSANMNVTFIGFVGQDHVSTAYRTYGPSFVAKSHDRWDYELAYWQKQGELLLFTAGLIPGKDALYRASLYNQDRVELEECSLCQVDVYRHMFGLTDHEVAILKEYMHNYEQIRQCCGLQMSHYEMARLNGCNMSSVVDKPDYPHCESLNKSALEQALAHGPIPHRTNDPQYNWAQPGDCAKFDAIIASGKGFNGKRKFDHAKDCPVVQVAHMI